jgi:homoserine O-succinyltransferase
LKEIFSYCLHKKIPVLGLCWGGLAVGELLGIKKVNYSKKLFGVFEATDLTKGMLGDCKNNMFFCPQSRFAGIEDCEFEQVLNNGNLIPLAYGKETGYFVFQSVDKLLTAHLGHPEYHKERIVEEYFRDKLLKITNVTSPVNFNVDTPKNTWKNHRKKFFLYWLLS